MPTPVTEIVVLSLQPGAEFADTIKEFFSILSRQPGFLNGHWGKWVENQDKVQIVVEWDDISSHTNFNNSGADFTALGSLILPHVTSPPEIHHVHFFPPLSTILHASPAFSVTEIATFYSPVPSFKDDITVLLADSDNTPGLKGACRGMVVEEEKNAYQFFVEWESIKAHEDSTKREGFEAKVQLASRIAERVEMHHVMFQAA